MRGGGRLCKESDIVRQKVLRPIQQMGRGDQGERVGQGCQSDIGIPRYQDITPGQAAYNSLAEKGINMLENQDVNGKGSNKGVSDIMLLGNQNKILQTLIDSEPQTPTNLQNNTKTLVVLNTLNRDYAF